MLFLTPYRILFKDICKQLDVGCFMNLYFLLRFFILHCKWILGRALARIAKLLSNLVKNTHKFYAAPLLRRMDGKK